MPTETATRPTATTTTATAATRPKAAANGAAKRAPRTAPLRTTARVTPIAAGAIAQSKVGVLASYKSVAPGIRFVSANTPMGFSCEVQEVLNAETGKLGEWHHVDYVPVSALRPILIQAGMLPNS